jgi:hypothetical protein
MERNRALGVAGATTLAAGAAIVAAAAIGGASLLGFGGNPTGPGRYTATPADATVTVRPKTVTRTHNVYDNYVIETTTVPRSAPSSPGPPSGAPNVGVTSATPGDSTATTVATRPGPPPRDDPDPVRPPVPNPGPTTTTVGATTTTTTPQCHERDDDPRADPRSGECNDD